MAQYSSLLWDHQLVHYGSKMTWLSGMFLYIAAGNMQVSFNMLSMQCKCLALQSTFKFLLY